MTDGRTDILPRHSPRYAYASRGKNAGITADAKWNGFYLNSSNSSKVLSLVLRSSSLSTNLAERSGHCLLTVLVPRDGGSWSAVSITTQSDSWVNRLHVHSRLWVHVPRPHWTVFFTQTNAQQLTSVTYKPTLKIKRLKTDRLLKWCSSAGRLFQGFSTVSVKKHLRTSAVAGEESVSKT